MPAPVRKSRSRRLGAVDKPSMFPHTVTLYNIQTETDPATLQDVTTSYITILRGVFLDATKAVNVRQSGLEGADAVALYIPFSVDAVDGVTGKAKRYVWPLEFWRAEDKRELWTLSTGGNTFFVKGEAVEPDRDVQFIEMMYDHVYDITSIDEKDVGGSMAHWEVGGN